MEVAIRQTTPQPVLNVSGVTSASGNVCVPPQSMQLKELNYSVKHLFHTSNLGKACCLEEGSTRMDLCILIPVAPFSCGY